jgi:hypothetical protein
MGLRCASCGVFTNPVAISQGTTNVFFEDLPGITTNGVATIFTDACSDTLDLSTASITFVATFDPTRSFVFTSTNITSVVCAQDCTVIVDGTGLVTGENTPRQFEIVFRPDNTVAFVIVGFVGSIFFPVQPGAFTVTGCVTVL